MNTLYTIEEPPDVTYSDNSHLFGFPMLWDSDAPKHGVTVYAPHSRLREIIVLLREARIPLNHYWYTEW